MNKVLWIGALLIIWCLLTRDLAKEDQIPSGRAGDFIKTIKRNGVIDLLGKFAYPREIEFTLLEALIWTESSGNPESKNTAEGSYGLMSIKLSTAGDLMGAEWKKKSKSTRIAELMAPDLNLDLGTRYLRQCYDDPRLGKNWYNAVAAYKGGPNAVATYVLAGRPFPYEIGMLTDRVFQYKKELETFS